MSTNLKRRITVSGLVAIFFALCAWYHVDQIDKAKYSETDAILAQAGQLVTIHRILSKENEKHEPRQLGWLLADADQKLRDNEENIMKFMAPANKDSYREMARKLHGLEKTYSAGQLNPEKVGQVISPNRSQPPTQNSTPSVSGAED